MNRDIFFGGGLNRRGSVTGGAAFTAVVIEEASPDSILVTLSNGGTIRVYVEPFFIFSDVVTLGFTGGDGSILASYDVTEAGGRTFVIGAVACTGSVDNISVYSEVVTNNSYNPISLTPAVWVNAENITDIGGFADAMLDQSGNVYNLSAAAADQRPAIVANDKNNFPALHFDAANDRLGNSGNLSVPLSIYIAGRYDTYSGCFLSSRNAEYCQVGINAGAMAMYFGVNLFITPYNDASMLDPAVMAGIANGASSRWDFNGSHSDGDSGAEIRLTGVIVGANSNIPANLLDGRLWEVLIFSAAHSAANELKNKKYLSAKYDVLTQLFDRVFRNSVQYQTTTYGGRRSPFSEVRFNMSGTKLRIWAYSSYYTFTPAICHFIIYIDGTYNQTVQLTSASEYQDVILPAGPKDIRIVEGSTYSDTSATGVIGTYITNLLSNSSFVQNKDNVAEKIVFIGDSITVGYGLASPGRKALARLFYEENQIEIAVHGWSAMRLFTEAGTAGNVTTTVGYVTTMFSDCTTTKKLVIHVGINDFQVDTRAAADMGTYLAALLDGINASDGDIWIYCVSPIRYSGDPALVADYRTAYSTVCAARSSFVTYINGYGILDLATDYQGDSIHPSEAGTKKMKDALYAVMYP